MESAVSEFELREPTTYSANGYGYGRAVSASYVEAIGPQKWFSSDLKAKSSSKSTLPMVAK
jgi:hypothetical protein